MRTRILYSAFLATMFLACNDQKRSAGDYSASPETQTSQEDTTATEDNFLIEKRSAGEFKLGAPIPVALEGYSITREQQVRTTEEGPTTETVFSIKEGNEELLKILPAFDMNTGESTDDIGEMRIISDKFRTKEGIGAGSTLEEFIKAYPHYKIWYTYVSDMYVVETEEVEAQFLLEGEDFIGEKKISSEMTPLKKEDFRKGAQISIVRMIE